MPLFRNKLKTETPPATPPKPEGTPPETPPATPPEGDFVPKADFDKLQENFEDVTKKLDEVNLRMEHYGQPQQPAAPAAPAGPTESEKLQDQIKDLNGKIGKLTTQIDEAYTSAQPIGNLLAKKDELISERAGIQTELRMLPKITQLEAAGTQALDQLSQTVTESKMPLLSNSAVKQSYEEMLNTIDPSAKMNPAVRLQVYNFAVGQNHEALVEERLQVEARKETETVTTQQPGTTTGRETTTESTGPPKPEDVLSRDNLDAIQSSGRTVDGYYQSLGYASWDDFWEQTGKEYFTEEGETT
jgi:hypothetical protein